MQAVVERCKEAGAKRAIPLEVSGPFHSSLMKPASERLAEVLASIEMKDAAVPVVANVTATSCDLSQPIFAACLVEQVYSPVLWEDTIAYLISKA